MEKKSDAQSDDFCAHLEKFEEVLRDTSVEELRKECVSPEVASARTAEAHAKIEAVRNKYNLPPAKEPVPVNKTTREINGREYKITEYDSGYTMAAPVDNSTYEQRIETLIVEISFLAAHYFYNYRHNDCKEIKEAFSAYFAVIYSSPEWNGMLHSEIIGDALLIFQTFQKFEDDIDPKIHGDAFNAIYWIWDKIVAMSLGLSVIEFQEEKADFPDIDYEVDECKKAIREYYRKYSADFIKRQKQKEKF